MHNANALKIGLFGANCSSGRAVTLVAERWSGNWSDNLRLARMADEAGIDFLLPIARWKGYGGDTDYQGATFETVTWACGLLASTKRVTVFGTVHAPLFNPLIAAKEFVTADHIGEGRFGLNLVVGWNEDEFDMFGVKQRDHEQRYEYAQEWIDAVKLAWGPQEDFDFHGDYIRLSNIRAKPKPFGGTRPLIMNAGASPAGRAFALRNCDAFFTQASRRSMEETAQRVLASRRKPTIMAARSTSIRSASSPADRPARRRGTIIDTASSKTPTGRRLISSWQRRTSAAKPSATPSSEQQRTNYANGMGGVPIVGDPDHVAAQLADLSRAGPARHRHLVRQLCRRIAIFLRRGNATARTVGRAHAPPANLAAAWPACRPASAALSVVFCGTGICERRGGPGFAVLNRC